MSTVLRGDLLLGRESKDGGRGNPCPAGVILNAPQVTRILEIGVLNGFATVNMGLALQESGRNGAITSVDLFLLEDDRYDEQWFDENCLKYGVGDLVTKIKGHSQDARVRSLLKGKRFDLIFHDASHQYEGVMPDILSYDTQLAVGGFFCLPRLH
jgi:predicted O-methyltransferase YrrM